MKTALTDRAVETAKHDTGPLLRVRPSGAKSYALVEPSHSAASQHGGGEQMFGAKQQVPHGVSGD
jgi:hypothetical protein